MTLYVDPFKNGCYGNFSGLAKDRKNTIKKRRKQERKARKEMRRKS